MSEIKKGESWRKGYMQGCSETEKAFGGCKKCYGKGYSTVFGREITARNYREKIREVEYCDCDRGKQIQKYFRIQGRR